MHSSHWGYTFFTSPPIMQNPDRHKGKSETLQVDLRRYPSLSFSLYLKNILFCIISISASSSSFFILFFLACLFLFTLLPVVFSSSVCLLIVRCVFSFSFLSASYFFFLWTCSFSCCALSYPTHFFLLVLSIYFISKQSNHLPPLRATLVYLSICALH